MFNVIDHLHFYSCECWDCVGMDPCALLCQGAYDVVKMALERVFDWQHRC